MKLSELKPGQSARIGTVGGEGALRQHFLDMGVIPGAEIMLVKLAPMGDPMEFRLHGYELTLRVADAENITVLPAERRQEAERAAVDTQRQLQELRRQVRAPSWAPTPGAAPFPPPGPQGTVPRLSAAQTHGAQVGPASETQGQAPNSLLKTIALMPMEPGSQESSQGLARLCSTKITPRRPSHTGRGDRRWGSPDAPSPAPGA